MRRHERRCPRTPYRTIRELADDERLLAHGPGVLSDAELVAVVVASGTQGENVIDLARGLLESVGGLPGLVRAGRIDLDDRPLLTTPEAVWGYLGSALMAQTTEELLALSLDTRGRLLGRPAPVAGHVNSVDVRPAEVFREPIVLKATSVILVHNHPSGDPRPSPQDVAVTKTLAAAGELLGLEVLDHVVIGQNRWVSLRREGLGFS